MTNMDLTNALKKIKLLILDVDGVLTDGTLYFSEAGEVLKSFCVKDGLGLKMLQAQGIDVAIITGRNSPMVSRRADDIGVKYLYQGQLQKMIAFQDCQKKAGVKNDEIAYVGDDIIDRQVLKTAGIAIAPADAVDDIKNICHWITQAKGGQGCVREVTDAILKAQGRWEAAVRAYEC